MFLIDNSKSMQQFEKEVMHTFINLAYILEKADDDGLDVVCTSQWDRQWHDRRTDTLAKLVQDNFQKGIKNRCFIERSLHALLTNVIKELPSGAGAESKNRRKLRSFIGKDKGRPISIYILTNGVWDPSAQGRNDVCNADTPIRQLIKELKKRNLHRSQVSLQFIRFGNDETGIRRLTHLDDVLGKEFPGL